MVDGTLVGVPLYTLAAYEGMGVAPSALRGAGLLSALAAQVDLGDLPVPQLKKDILEGRTKNLNHFKSATTTVFAALKAAKADRVFILGGECSETVGAMAGLAEAFGGKAGMLWLDAHGDFNTPDTSPSGYIGGMCLAFACGRSPELGLFSGASAPLADERLVHVGSRALDPPEVAAFTSSPAKLFTSQQVKRTGAAEVAEEAARHLENRSDWIACHLDVDVIDPAFMPAVNYPEPGGLTPDECSSMIKAVVATGKLRALEIAAYNPQKERTDSSASALIDMLRRALG
ncbi:MAG TPA: arginase family protein [Nitrososphaerales archaeon]|nr:arginase family protein [Nitrososphaerales archaeon]